MSEIVTVIIPLWKEEVTYFEEISLRQNLSILQKHIFTIITHQGLNISWYIELFIELNVNYKVVLFPSFYFKDTDGYNKLMLSYKFYSKFSEYKFILICQLDCFIFKDELHSWARKNYSYIGAPWMYGYDSAKEDAPVIGVGNGGLSLRRVKHFIKILTSFSYVKDPISSFRVISKNSESQLNKWIKFIQFITLKNNTFYLFNDWENNEDIFWSRVASKNFYWFKIPSWDIAKTFSIEVNPKIFIKYNEGHLPFGCHAWWKHDLDFWRPYIKSYGHDI